MQINNVNNMNFGNLHIKSNVTNKVVLEKMLKRNPDATIEALADIDRESGEKDVYMYSGICDGSNIDVVLADKKTNIIASRRIGIGNSEHFKIALDRLVYQFTEAICRPKALNPSQNDDINEILNKYA